MEQFDAKKRLDLDDEKKRMDELGIMHGVRGMRDLDEAPGAYKDIDEVMDRQKDLVKVLYRLRPVAVIKA